MHVDRILWRALRADAVDDGHGTDRVLMPVPRSSLIEKLAREDSRPVVSVVAPLATGRPRCCRSGPSVTARRSPGCRSMTGTTLALRAGGLLGSAAVSFAGDDRLVSDRSLTKTRA